MPKKDPLTPSDVKEKGLLQKLTHSGVGIDLSNLDRTDTSPGTEQYFFEPSSTPNVFKSILDDDEINEYLSDPIEEAFMDLEDVEELKAKNQSTFGNYAWRGPVRTVAKAVQELLKGIGTIGGAIAWSGAELADLAGLTEHPEKSNVGLIFDNAFNKGVDNIFNEYVYENESLGLKVHVPKKVKEGSLLDNLGDSSFWASEGADAVGFFASMMVPGAALTKTGLGAKIAGGLNKLGKLRYAPKFLSKVSKSGVDNILAATTNTIIESGAEASGTYQHIKDDLIAKGEDPEIANAVASEQAAKVFNTNMAILIGPNMFQHKMLFGRFNPKVGPGLLSSIDKQAGRLTGMAVRKNTDFLKDFGKKITKGIASEGFFEEGLQTATEEYFTQQGLNEKEKVKSAGFFDNILKDLKGIANTYSKMLPNDVGMQKAIFLGGLLGGVGGGFGAYRSFQAAQDKIYGYDGPKNTLGKIRDKIVPRTRRKGLKNIIDESLATTFATMESLPERDENGRIQIDELGKAKLNPVATKILGESKAKTFISERLKRIEDIQGNREGAEEVIERQQFDMFKDFLDTEEGVAYLKEEFIPNKSDELIISREKYANELTAEEYKELSPEEITAKKEELVKKVDSFKQIYDDVLEQHNLSDNIKYTKEQTNAYNAFNEVLQSTRLDARVASEFSKKRISQLETKVNNNLGKSPFVDTKVSNLKVDDIIEYQGKKAQYIGNGKAVDFENQKEFSIRVTPADKESNIDLKKLDSDKGTNLQIIEDVKALNFNKERLKDSKKALDTLYDSKEVQKYFNDVAKAYTEYNKKVAFLNEFTPNTSWRDKESGNIVKVRKLKNGDLGLFEGELDRQGNISYTKELSTDEFDSSIDKFKEKYEPFQEPTPQPKPKVEEKTEEEASKEANKVETEETKPSKEETKPKEVKKVKNIKSKSAFQTPPADVLKEIEGEISGDKPPVNPAVEENTPEINSTKEEDDNLPLSKETKEEVDTSPSGFDLYEKASSLRRHVLNLFNGTANNPRKGNTEEYTGDPNPIKAEFVASNFALDNGNYKLKAIKADATFPSDRSTHDKSAGQYGYKFEDLVYLVLTDNNGNLLGLSEDGSKLEPLGNQDINFYDSQRDKDIIFWTLREDNARSKTTGNELFYRPDLDTQMDQYEDLFEEVRVFKGKKAEKKALASNLFDQLLEDETKKFSEVRKNIIKDLLQNKDVSIEITGKSLGVPNKSGNFKNVISSIAEFEGISEQELRDNLEIKVADSNLIMFGDNKINTRPGKTYAYNKLNNRVYDLEPRKLNDKDIEDVISMLEYYVEDINNQRLDGVDAKKIDFRQAEIIRTKIAGKIRPLIIDQNEIGIFDIISKMIHPNYLSFSKFGTSGRSMKLLVEGRGGKIKSKPMQIIQYDKKTDNLVLNSKLRAALQENLPGYYYQTKSIKIKNDERYFKINKVDTQNGVIDGKLENYRDSMLDDVLTTDIIKRNPKEVEMSSDFGGKTKIIQPPLFESVYLKMNLDPFVDPGEKNNVPSDIDKETPKLKQEVSKTQEELDDEAFLKNAEDVDEFGEDGLFRRDFSQDYERINVEKAKEWFLERFPQFGEEGFRVLNGLIKKGIHGAVHNAAMYIDANAAVGTEFHEAFHMVTHYLISESERKALYKEWRDRNKGSELSDKEIEEILAEDYKDYEINGGRLELPPVQENIFRKIIRWIKQLFSKYPSIQETFKRISSGYYSTTQVNPNTEISFKREARFFISDNPEQNTHEFYHEVMEATNVYFFDEIRKSEGSFDLLFNKEDNSKLIEDTYNKIKQIFETKRDAAIETSNFYKNKAKNQELSNRELALGKNAIKRKYALNFILEQFEGEKFESFKNKHALVLQDYGLDTKIVGKKIVDNTKEFDEDTVKDQTDTIENTKDTGWELSDRAIKFSAKLNAQKNIKLLVGTLPELRIDEDGKAVRVENRLGLPKTMRFGSMFNSILANLSGVKTVGEVISRLDSLKKDIPALEYFFTNNGLDLDKVKQGNLAISRNKFNETLQFTQTFSKTENQFTIDLLNPGGVRKFEDANSYTKRRGIKANWETNANKIDLSDSKFIQNGFYNSDAFAKVKLDPENPSTYYDFFKNIGIEFSNPSKIAQLGLNNDLYKLAEYTLKDIIAQGNKKPNIFRADVETNSGQDLDKIADIEYVSNIDLNELSHIGLDGETIYNHTLNSYLSTIFDNINKINTREDLVKFYPHLDAKTISYLNNSLLLKEGGVLFDSNGNKRAGADLQFIINEGISEKEEGNTIQYDRLSRVDRLASIIDRSLRGEYNLIRTADKKLERFIKIDLSKHIHPDNYLEYFTGYLKDELLRTKIEMYKKKKTNWNNYDKNIEKGIFIEMIKNYSNSESFVKSFEEFISNRNLDIKEGFEINEVEKFLLDSFNKEMIEAAFNNYINTSVDSLISWMLDNKVIEKNENTGKIKSNGISFIENRDSYNLSEIDSALFNFVVEDTIMNVEQTKLLFGDPIYYDKVANFFKRTGSFPGTRKLMISDYITDEFIEENMKRVDGAEGLVDTKTGAKVFSIDKSKTRNKGIVKQLVVNDIEVVDEIFGDIGEEADGYSMVSFDEYREMLFRVGDWTFGENSLEDLYQWEMQTYYGNNMDKIPLQKGDKSSSDAFKRIFGHKWDGIVRDTETGREISKRPTVKINMLKPLYVGPYAEKGFVPGITKTSFGVLYPSFVKGRPNLESTMNFMTKNQVGVLSFHSANKGISTKKNNEGNFNELYDDKGKLNLDNLDFSDNGNAVTQNTFYEFWGIQLDTGFKNKTEVITGTQMMKQILSFMMSNGEIKDEFKDLTNKDGVHLIDEYKSLNNERLELGKEEFLKSLDIELNENNQYVIKDYNKFKEKLRSIADQRGMDDNTYDSIDFIDERLGMDMLVNRSKFEAAIFGLNDSLVIKQKRKGGAFYQMPSTLFELNAREYDKESGKLKSSKELKAYTKTTKDGKTIISHMEVLLPNSYKNYPFEELSDVLKEGIAFRIPTQGLASIEAIKIVGFLDESAGDTVVLPSSIVKKAGSDYDIDKLNIYLPNYFMDKDGKPTYIDANKLSYETYLLLKDKKAEKLSKSKFRKLAVENRIMEIQKSIVLNPANYENLTKSLDSNLVKDLADTIYKERTGEDRASGSLLDIVDRLKLLDTADRFLSSKQAVGITSLASPFHIMAQMTDLYIEDLYEEKTPTKINLPHNTNKDGKISISGETAANGEDIAKSLVQWISEAVDAAKDPRMFDLNVNLETLSVVLYLTMAGVPTENIMYFLNQPIIHDYVNAQNNNRSALMAVNKSARLDRSGKPITIKGKIQYKSKKKYDDEIISELVKKYGGKQNKEREFSLKDLKDHMITGFQNINASNKKALTKRDGKYIYPDNYLKDQVSILKDYIRYKETSAILSGAIQASSYDTNSAGKSIPELMLKLENTANNINKTVKIDKDNIKKVIGNYSNLLLGNSFINPYFENNRKLIKELSPVFPIPLKDKSIKTLIKHMIKRFEVSPYVEVDKKTKVLDNFVSAYLTYNMITKPYPINLETDEDTFFDKVSKQENTLEKEFNRLFKGGNSVAKRLKVIQDSMNQFRAVANKEKSLEEVKATFSSNESYRAARNFYIKYKNNAILNALIPNISSEEEYFDHVILYNRKRDLLETSKLVDSWNTILNDENISTKRLGLDLIKLLVLQNGLQPSPLNFINLVPTEIYSNLVLSTMNNRFLDEHEANKDAYRFYIEYQAENSNNNLLVPRDIKAKNYGAWFPLVKSAKSLKEDISENEARDLIQKGVNVYKDKANIKLSKKGLFSEPINEYLGKSYSNPRNNKQVTLYGRTKETLWMELGMEEFNLIFGITKVESNMSDRLIEESTKENENLLPYSEYNKLEGVSEITEEDWNKLTKEQQEEAIKCKSSGAKVKFVKKK